MTILIFLAVLSLLIFVHEFAHFFLAKRFGVGVEEFGFGIPPRLFGRRIGETVYSINALPFGGFVKLRGEFGEGGGADGDELLGIGGSGSFAAAPKGKRALIILGGVLGNLVFAYLILVALFAIGYPVFSGRVKILEAVKESPAAAAGLKSGEFILAIDGRKVAAAEELIKQTKKKAGTAVTLEIEGEEGEKRTVEIVPRQNPPEGQGALGVKIGVKGFITYRKYPWPTAPVRAFSETTTIIKEMTGAWGRIVGGLVLKKRLPKEISGVVGVYTLTGEAASLGINVFLQFVAVLSLNLFLFNLFPIPALDGGRLFFIGLETLFRRPLPVKVERWANNLGLAFLLTLFILVTVQDVSRLWG